MSGIKASISGARCSVQSHRRRLQYFWQACVFNMTPFGQDLRKFFDANVALVLEEFRHGWMDGGCWTLAYAVAEWAGSDAEMVGIYLGKGDVIRTDHVAVKLFGASVFIDGDGLSDEAAMIKKAERQELREWKVSIGPLKPEPQLWADGLCLYAHVWPELSLRLFKRFGSWRDMRSCIADVLEISVSDGG